MRFYVTGGTGFTKGEIDMRATPSLASESAEMMRRIIQGDRQGIFHCCCGQSISRMDLAVAAASAFDLDAGLLQNDSPD